MALGDETNAGAVYRTWLLSSSTITDEVGSSGVFVTEIPSTQIDSMPKKLILIIPDKGIPENVSVPIVPSLFQVRCFGATAFEASEVSAALFNFAHRKGDLQVSHGGSTFNLYLSRRRGSPQYFTEPDTGWPLYLNEYEVKFFEVAVA